MPHIQAAGEHAERHYSRPKKLDDMLFLRDPLDGTRDFVAKRDNFTVNIGLVHNTIRLPVIYAPVHEKTVFQRRGLTARWCALRLTAISIIQAAEKLTFRKN